MKEEHPRELELAKEELNILRACVDREDTELGFLELHARTLLHHILNARAAVNLESDRFAERRSHSTARLK